jgi:hypothetical protein
MPSDDGWMIQDLGSKNGTVFDGERLRTPKVLKDSDVVRLGRSKIIFHAGVMDEDFADEVLAPARPATPGDSLAGTLSGFQLLLPGEGEIPEDMPCPQPRPKDPPGYENNELQELLTAIASSSWDSVYAEARQPLRGGQGIELDDDSQPRRRVRPSSPTDISLQASPAAVTLAPAIASESLPIEMPLRPRRRLIDHLAPSLQAAVAMIWLMLVVLLSVNRKPIASGSLTPLGPLPQTPQAWNSPQRWHAPEAAVGEPTDGDTIEAADEESPAPQPPKWQWNSAAAIEACKTAALHFPVVW